VIRANVEMAVIAPNSRWLATCDLHTVHLWDLETADPVSTGILLRGFDQGLRNLLFTPDSQWLVTYTADKTVRCWDLRRAFKTPP
jgi:WD40 repeat protein